MKTLVLTPLVAFLLMAASPADGTVKVHGSPEPSPIERNVPHVCEVVLRADDITAGTWQVRAWPPTGDERVVASGVIDGSTVTLNLDNGHYKLDYAGKHKTFWVECDAVPVASDNPTTPTTLTKTAASLDPLTMPATDVNGSTSSTASVFLIALFLGVMGLWAFGRTK